MGRLFRPFVNGGPCAGGCFRCSAPAGACRWFPAGISRRLA